jgi:hypothetical protein
MSDKPSQSKKGRKKTRLLGTTTPPRKSFTMRLEAQTFDRLNMMLASFQGSRNDYIERLIEHDLSLRERMKPLNS